jgi:hypothetical protein
MRSITWLMAIGLIGPTAKIINFDTAALGGVPPGWTVAMTNRGAAPQWEIRRDLSAPTQPYVLAQVSTDPTGNRFPLAILDSVQFRDGDVSVRLKPVAGRQDEAGGVVFRYIDANNYYLARANAIQGNVALYKVENGERTQIAVARHDLPLNGWRILKVSARGARLQVYLDHRRILQSWDATFSGSGKVGLWTVGDSVTYFDDFRVYTR